MERQRGFAYQKRAKETHDNQPVACSKHTCTSDAQLMPAQNKDRKNISHAKRVGGYSSESYLLERYPSNSPAATSPG